MTQLRRGNFAYIDGQNLHLGMRDLGWKLDMARFRIYLAEKYDVTVAKFFIGYIPENENLYNSLRRKGYELVFKQTTKDTHGKPKGNIDAEMILEAVVDHYEQPVNQAILVTSDGDFCCLVDFLKQHDKLLTILSPCELTCSKLLKNIVPDKIQYLENMKEKLEYKIKSTA